MTAILVEAAGLSTTVQDLGREGYGAMGVSPSGAADRVSLRLGNRLVGNPEGAAALEMTLLGGAFRFLDEGVAALTGSDFNGRLDDAAVDRGTTFAARAGQVLKLGPTRSGARSYLCVGGGIEVPLFLGSASTHALSGLGGFEGRQLRAGDVLQIGPSRAPFKNRTIAPKLLGRICGIRRVLRVTAGPQAAWFSELSSFYASSFSVAEQSDRMGLRLEGAIVAHAAKPMVTEGVSLGAIQVPSSGSPIILFVDQQTTGGYPKIANVISADLHHVGQLRPRDQIRFELVSFEKARELLLEQEQMLASSEAILE
jgi:antagonist of KipI